MSAAQPVGRHFLVLRNMLDEFIGGVDNLFFVPYTTSIIKTLNRKKSASKTAQRWCACVVHASHCYQQWPQTRQRLLLLKQEPQLEAYIIITICQLSLMTLYMIITACARSNHWLSLFYVLPVQEALALQKKYKTKYFIEKEKEHQWEGIILPVMLVKQNKVTTTTTRNYKIRFCVH